MDLLPEMGAVLKPVGRLDMDTKGVLLFTNDGDLAALLTHPTHMIEKEYIAHVRGMISETALERLRNGIPLDGRYALCQRKRRSSPAIAKRTKA